MHIPSGFLISYISSFQSIINKYDVYRGKDCMKKVCASFKERTMEITNFEKKKMMPLTNKDYIYHNQKIRHICKEKFKNKYADDIKRCKVRSCCHYTGKYRSAAHIICNLKYITPKEIPVISTNESKYDYHHSIGQLVK